MNDEMLTSVHANLFTRIQKQNRSGKIIYNDSFVARSSMFPNMLQCYIQTEVTYSLSYRYMHAAEVFTPSVIITLKAPNLYQQAK